MKFARRISTCWQPRDFAFRIASNDARGLGRAVRAFAPWGLLIVCLFLVGVWIVLEPMEMRGTLPMGG